MVIGNPGIHTLRQSGITLIASLFLAFLYANECRAQWQIHDGRDQMSGDRALSATISTDIESRGRHGDLDVTAQCNLTNGAITLNFVYRSKFQEGVGFYLTQPDPTIVLGQNYSHKALAQMREKIGDGPVVSSPASSDYPNQAHLLFIPDVAPDDPALVLMLVPHSGGKVSDLVSAQSAKFEFTLQNSDTPIFQMNPQDEAFQHFASTCSHKGVEVNHHNLSRALDRRGLYTPLLSSSRFCQTLYKKPQFQTVSTCMPTIRKSNSYRTLSRPVPR